MKFGLDAKADSAGTADWHVGKSPDLRAQTEALRNGIDISGYRARQVRSADFREFTHILALDNDNLANLEAIRPANGTASVSLLLDFVEGMKGRAVADPYYGDERDFAETWAQVSRAARALVRSFAGK